MRSVINRTIIMLIAGCLLAPVIVAQEEPTPSLRNWMVLSVNDHLLRNVQLSADGQFIAAMIVEPEEQFGVLAPSNIYLWNISDLDSTVYNSEPVSTIALDQNAYDANLAFSADAQYLAVRTDGHLSVYTTPELQFHSSISLETLTVGRRPLQSLAWSQEGHVLLTVDGLGTRLVVWDVDSGEHYSYDTSYQPNIPRELYILPVTDSIEGGWIISKFVDSSIGFIACTLRLEECQTYEGGLFARFTNDGSYVLSVFSEPLTLWNRENEIYYTPRTLEIYAYDISPNGNYFIATCAESNKNRILAFDTLSVIQTYEVNRCGLSLLNNPIWFPSEEFFVMLEVYPRSSLRLYEVGQEAPVEMLEFPPLPEHLRIGISDMIELPIITIDATLILVNMGGIVRLVRIEN